MKYKQIYYPETKLGGFSFVDGTIAFYIRVNALLTPESQVVDIGCGRGAYGDDTVPFRRQLRILKGKCHKVTGIDISTAGLDNPYIDEFRLIEKENWPIKNQSIDLCLADNVLEHISDPEAFFSECHRILRPGGVVCIRTPNVFSYFGLIARLVPNSQHTSMLQKVKDQVNEQDVFPTQYRCNTIGKIRQSLARHGFEPYVYGYDAEPSYLSFGRLFYFLGVMHQRYAPGFLKVGIHAFGINGQTVNK
jgi:SAM-dependent methyltransferase